MNCPQCGHHKSLVIDTRPRIDAKSIRRRRECEKCGLRWTTREVVTAERHRSTDLSTAMKALNDIQNVLITATVERNDD